MPSLSIPVPGTRLQSGDCGQRRRLSSFCVKPCESGVASFSDLYLPMLYLVFHHHNLYLQKRKAVIDSICIFGTARRPSACASLIFERVLLWCRLRRPTPSPQFCSLLSFAFDGSVHNMVDLIYVFLDVDKHP